MLAAALMVFSRKGYSGTTLDDVAQEAKATRGAIYWHFKNKADLYNTLVSERAARINAVFKDAVESRDTPLNTLRTLLVRVLEYIEEDPEYRAIMEIVFFKTAFDPDLEKGLASKRQSVLSFFKFVVELISMGIQKREIRADVRPEDAALAALGLINGLSFLWLLNPGMFSVKSSARRIVDLYIGALTTKA